MTSIGYQRFGRTAYSGQISRIQSVQYCAELSMTVAQRTIAQFRADVLLIW
mgnify:CR=1 FL=1